MLITCWVQSLIKNAVSHCSDVNSLLSFVVFWKKSKLFVSNVDKT